MQILIDSLTHTQPAIHRLCKLVFYVTLFFYFFIPPVEANSLINVPLNAEISDFSDETYAFVYRFLNKRALPGITRGLLPLTRGQIASLLLDLSEKHARGEITMSQIDQRRLKALMRLFADELPPEQAPLRDRLHVMQLKGNDYHFALDLGASQRAISRNSESFPMEGTAHITSLIPQVHGQVRDDFAFSTNIGYNFLYGKIFDDLFPDEASYKYLDKIKSILFSEMLR